MAERDSESSRAQRVLAGMAFTLIGISAIAVIALLILHAAGVPQGSFTSGGLLVLAIIPYPGLIIGLLLLIALIVLLAVRRGRTQSPQRGRR